jgi:Fic family protein
MAKNTRRDGLWISALRETHTAGQAITAEKLAKYTGSSERSARDVLKTMAENGFLREEKKGREVRYIPGEL